jgi:hypothetical protein
MRAGSVKGGGIEAVTTVAITVASDATGIGAGGIPSKRVEGASRGFSGVLSTRVVVLLRLGVCGINVISSSSTT